MTTPEDTMRAEFEAAMGRKGYEMNPTRFRDGSYTAAYYQAGWEMWQRQAAELERLIADNASYVRIASEQATELERMRAEGERTARNRDMWKGQCERQAAELQRLRSAIAAVFDTLDGANKDGSITRTIWHGPGETLWDFIENTLAAAPAQQAEPEPEVDGWPLWSGLPPAPSLTVGDEPSGSLEKIDAMLREYRESAAEWLPGSRPEALAAKARYTRAHDAIRAALAPAEQAEPVAWREHVLRAHAKLSSAMTAHHIARTVLESEAVEALEAALSLSKPPAQGKG